MCYLASQSLCKPVFCGCELVTVVLRGSELLGSWTLWLPASMISAKSPCCFVQGAFVLPLSLCSLWTGLWGCATMSLCSLYLDVIVLALYLNSLSICNPETPAGDPEIASHVKGKTEW